MWIFTGANIALLAIITMILLGLLVAIWKPLALDFVKANFGLLILTLLFTTLLAISLHVYREGSTNALGKDFLAWLEQKAGEVLASVMTVIVGARATNQRATDNPSNATNGNGKKLPSTATGVTHP